MSIDQFAERRRVALPCPLDEVVIGHTNCRQRGGFAGWVGLVAGLGSGLESAADLDLPDAASVAVDTQLLVDEARIGCSSGMLLCLDREQRLIYVLGEILGVTSTIGAELLDITSDNFRQKLARARRDLHSFMHDKCGLVNKANPCRCAKKTRAFMDAGYVDPKNLRFARAHVTRVREVAARTHQDLAALDAAYAEIHRDHPFLSPRDFVPTLRALISQATFQSILSRSFRSSALRSTAGAGAIPRATSRSWRTT
jgi:DNA-directed RNA polymerase specialized sigma24 family protein